MDIMKRFILSLVAIISLVFSPVAANAVEYSGVGGQPANPQADNPRSQSIFIYTLNPGDQKQDGVRIYNNTNTSRTIAVGAVDSALSSDGAFSCAQEVEAKKDVGSWINLSSSSVTIPSGGSVVVPFTITAPSNASVGEHDGCITMQDSSTQAATNQNGVVLSFRSAIRVVATIPGKIVKDLAITQLTIKLDAANQVLVDPTVSNTGNVSLDTNVTTSLVSLFGNTVASVKGTYPILARSTATWNLPLARPFWGGLYKASVSTTYNGTANTQLGLVDGSAGVTRKRDSGYIFITPALPAAIAELAVLLAIATGVFILVQKLRHKGHVKKHWHTYTVKSGDTVKQIAEQNGLPWKKLVTANRLKPPYDLREGHTIKIPPKKEG